MFDLKEYHLDTSSFMGGWFIPDEICDNLINFYNNNHRHIKSGKTAKSSGSYTDYEVKQSFDLGISPNNYEEPFLSYRAYLQQCLNNYQMKYPMVKLNSNFNITEAYQIQGYPKGGGFKKWHCEVTTPFFMRRVLVFMTYLNDVKDGGTEFYHQKMTTPCKKGLTIIWPAHWTHTHKGEISSKEEKLIITGWFNYT